MSKVKKFLLDTWENPIVRSACLTAVVVACSLVLDRANKSLGTTVSVSVNPAQNTLPQ